MKQTRTTIEADRTPRNKRGVEFRARKARSFREPQQSLAYAYGQNDLPGRKKNQQLVSLILDYLHRASWKHGPRSLMWGHLINTLNLNNMASLEMNGFTLKRGYQYHAHFKRPANDVQGFSRLTGYLSLTPITIHIRCFCSLNISIDMTSKL